MCSLGYTARHCTGILRGHNNHNSGEEKSKAKNLLKPILTNKENMKKRYRSKNGYMIREGSEKECGRAILSSGEPTALRVRCVKGTLCVLTW